MQIQKIQNNYINNSVNYSRKQNISNIQSIGFQGGKQRLISISANSFHSEYTQKLYSKIQKYFQLIGNSGNIKEVKLLHEKKHYHISKMPYITDVDADVCLSVNKGDRNSNLKLYHRFTDGNKKNEFIFDVTLDQNGQMIQGQFFPQTVSFVRDKGNVRRMYSATRGDSYLPVGSNDREWSCLGKENLSSHTLIDDSEKSAFEIFIELARLKTSIM